MSVLRILIGKVLCRSTSALLPLGRIRKRLFVRIVHRRATRALSGTFFRKIRRLSLVSISCEDARQIAGSRQSRYLLLSRLILVMYTIEVIELAHELQPTCCPVFFETFALSFHTFSLGSQVGSIFDGGST